MSFLFTESVQHSLPGELLRTRGDDDSSWHLVVIDALRPCLDSERIHRNWQEVREPQEVNGDLVKPWDLARYIR